jgi:hypothetical protein
LQNNNSNKTLTFRSNFEKLTKALNDRGNKLKSNTSLKKKNTNESYLQEIDSLSQRHRSLFEQINLVAYHRELKKNITSKSLKQEK